MNEMSKIEDKFLEVAEKLSNQKYLEAIRNAFITILPITVMGGLVSVISSAPVTPHTKNAFLLAWASFVKSNSLILTWINTLTLGAMAIFVCLTITWYLCKHYQISALTPLLLSFFGIMILTAKPTKLTFNQKMVEISYIDGKGLLIGIFVAIATVELYRFLKAKHFGEIHMPESVPASLSNTFASLSTSIVIMTFFSAIFIIFNKNHTTLAQWFTKIITPGLKATDSIWFVLIMTIIISIGWFFGIHNATFWGLMGPIMFINLSANAAANATGHVPPTFLTEATWAYFIQIGGVGCALPLAMLLLFSKSEQMRAVGKMGLIPSFFGISEPITFGLPVMLNPIMFIPAFLAPTVNAILTWLAMSLHLVKKTFAMLSFNMPSIFGSYFATSDFKGPVLIIILVIIDMVIYFPFMKVYEKAQLKEELGTN